MMSEIFKKYPSKNKKVSVGNKQKGQNIYNHEFV